MSTNHDVPDITIRPWRLDDFDAVKAILEDTFAGTWLPQLTPEAAVSYRESGEPAATSTTILYVKTLSSTRPTSTPTKDTA
jgi:hypothetical protein